MAAAASSIPALSIRRRAEEMRAEALYLWSLADEQEEIEAPLINDLAGLHLAKALHIIRITAAACGVSTESMPGRRRDDRHAMARQCATWLIRRNTALGYPTIGRVLHKHHSTLIHGYDRIEQRCQRQPQFFRWLQELEKKANARFIIPRNCPAWSDVVWGPGPVGE